VGEGSVLGPDVEATGASIGRGCRIRMTVLDGATVPDAVELGPFEHRGS
jgi:bifunctional N-acetylglucosamine-1-phosphate-uridyltransferase/glucosamine-1-phosphate-acetyltransferase GlmU-like protein